jgi:hypothetical protein
MRRIPWNGQRPGHCETGLVHHCGPTASGEYVCTVQVLDVATGWSELRAVLGRSYLVMEDALRYILTRSPFLLLELHPDNGSEFFNHPLLRFFEDLVQGVTLSRSRPYHKPVLSLSKGTTIASSNRRILAWFELTWATTGSIPSPKPSPSTNSTAKCGSTTTCCSQ